MRCLSADLSTTPFCIAGLLGLLTVIWVQPVCGQDAVFENAVLPILKAECFECHSHAHGESSGGLMLDSLAGMQAGGSRGSSLSTSGAPSLLLQAIQYNDDELQMPPSGKLSQAKIEILRNWLAGGAQVPESFVGQARESQRIDPLAHWAYQPLMGRQAAAPSSTLAQNPIDQIVGQGLEQQNIPASKRASPSTLLRRLSYDLIGLPPTFGEMQAARMAAGDEQGGEQFAADQIERLLASPHFGERWARHWMDVSRYADNKGYVFQEDREYPEAYKYRDWLIAAFNNDMPYDRFVKMQLAADLMPDRAASDIAALGFLTLGRRFLNNPHDIIDDRIDVTARGLMGMTLACARCHDHKYDPVTQKDYYALYGIFQNTQEPGGEPWPHRLAEADKLRDAFVLVRGQAGNRGDKVPRRFVSFLSSDNRTFESSSGRAELASRIVAADNPLTARVLANRVWMHLMGDSLVDSPSDFGIRCPEPVQRELLDSLAAYLIDQGWSIKRLIRLIVSSETYSQESLRRPEVEPLDPENKYYSRMNRKRQDFESLRDTWLAVTGNLNTRLAGSSEKIDAPPYSHRRTLYAYIDRQNLPSIFRTFDMASPDTHSARRAETSVPQQGLYMLNSGFIAELAGGLSKQLQRDVPEPDQPELDQPGKQARDSQTQDPGHAQRINWVFRQVLAREPQADELAAASKLVREFASPSPATLKARWICGYGDYDAEAGRLVSFQGLPHYTGTAWQGGADLPDKQLGWCVLNASGGHPGNDLAHSVVRRWIAPEDGLLFISGKLVHKASEGDGVRGTILHGRGSSEGGSESQTTQQERVGSWSAHNTQTDTPVQKLEVRAGDPIDFVTDCLAGPSHDSFDWKVRISYRPGRGSLRSEMQFPAPEAEPLDAWAVLIQALMATNELAFVD